MISAHGVAINFGMNIQVVVAIAGMLLLAVTLRQQVYARYRRTAAWVRNARHAWQLYRFVRSAPDAALAGYVVSYQAKREVRLRRQLYLQDIVRASEMIE
ncbi:hypothetical protein EON76_04960 [bacterium]|nr:MAG: hypothetical protein EON76_04960 [bacterium]